MVGHHIVILLPFFTWPKMSLFRTGSWCVRAKLEPRCWCRCEVWRMCMAVCTLWSLGAGAGAAGGLVCHKIQNLLMCGLGAFTWNACCASAENLLFCFRECIKFHTVTDRVDSSAGTQSIGMHGRGTRAVFGTCAKSQITSTPNQNKSAWVLPTKYLLLSGVYARVYKHESMCMSILWWVQPCTPISGAWGQFTPKNEQNTACGIFREKKKENNGSPQFNDPVRRHTQAHKKSQHQPVLMSLEMVKQLKYLSNVALKDHQVLSSSKSTGEAPTLPTSPDVTFRHVAFQVQQGFEV